MSNWSEMKQKGGFIQNNWLNSKMEILYEIIENPDNYTRSSEINEIKKKLDPILSDIKVRLLLRNYIVFGFA